MQSALLILLACAAIDVIACVLVLVLAWMEYRRMRKEAAATGETIPSAAGQFGCLIAFGFAGLVGIYGAVWLLMYW